MGYGQGGSGSLAYQKSVVHSSQRCFQTARAGPPLGGSNSPRLFSARRLAHPPATSTTRILSLWFQGLAQSVFQLRSRQRGSRCPDRTHQRHSLEFPQLLIELGVAVMRENLANSEGDSLAGRTRLSGGFR